MKHGIAVLTLLAGLFGFHRRPTPEKTLNRDVAISVASVLRSYTTGNDLEQYEQFEIAAVDGDLKALMAAPKIEDKALQKKAMDDLKALHERDDFLQFDVGTYRVA